MFGNRGFCKVKFFFLNKQTHCFRNNTNELASLNAAYDVLGDIEFKTHFDTHGEKKLAKYMEKTLIQRRNIKQQAITRNQQSHEQTEKECKEKMTKMQTQRDERVKNRANETNSERNQIGNLKSENEQLKLQVDCLKNSIRKTTDHRLSLKRHAEHSESEEKQLSIQQNAHDSEYVARMQAICDQDDIIEKKLMKFGVVDAEHRKKIEEGLHTEITKLQEQNVQANKQLIAEQKSKQTLQEKFDKEMGHLKLYAKIAESNLHRTDSDRCLQQKKLDAVNAENIELKNNVERLQAEIVNQRKNVQINQQIEKLQSDFQQLIISHRDELAALRLEPNHENDQNNEHQNLNVVSGETFACDNGTCQRKFASKNSLIRHRREDHRKNHQLDCDICGKTNFKSERILKTHIKDKHVNKKRFNCVHCQRKFNAKNYLTRHLKTCKKKNQTM